MVTDAEITAYFENMERRQANRKMQLIFDELTYNADDAICEALTESERIPVTAAEVEAVEKLNIGESTLLGAFTVKRIA